MRGPTDLQIAALRILARLCGGRERWATPRQVWQHGGAENIRGAGIVLGFLARAGMAERISSRSPGGDYEPTRYQPSELGLRAIAIDLRNGAGRANAAASAP